MLATKNGHTEIVKYLVEKGADVKRAKEVSILAKYFWFRIICTR